MFLKISPNSQENTCAGISFSVKFQACRGFYFSKVAGWKSATLLKMRLRLRAACKFTEKQASTQVFSCKFLRNFHEKLFCRTPPGHCFLMLHLISEIINKRKNKRRSGYFRYHPVFFCIFDNFYCRDLKEQNFQQTEKVKQVSWNLLHALLVIAFRIKRCKTFEIHLWKPQLTISSWER